MPNSSATKSEAYQAWTLDFQIIKPHSSLYKGMFSLDVGTLCRGFIHIDYTSVCMA